MAVGWTKKNALCWEPEGGNRRRTRRASGEHSISWGPDGREGASVKKLSSGMIQSNLPPSPGAGFPGPGEETLGWLWKRIGSGTHCVSYP